MQHMLQPGHTAQRGAREIPCGSSRLHNRKLQHNHNPQNRASQRKKKRILWLTSPCIACLLPPPRTRVHCCDAEPTSAMLAAALLLLCAGAHAWPSFPSSSQCAKDCQETHADFVALSLGKLCDDLCIKKPGLYLDRDQADCRTRCFIEHEASDEDFGVLDRYVRCVGFKCEGTCQNAS